MAHDLSRLGDWADLPFFRDHWPRIEAALEAERRPVLPPDEMRFRALERTQPGATRVVILGQDPYPTPGHANGLAFSVTRETKLPRSLANIFAELRDDIGTAPPDGDLTHWADQGVLLLNAALSVPERDPGAHARLGWSHLVSDVLSRLGATPRAFLLWGRSAGGFRPFIRGADHLIVSSAHPSPLSARQGFFGSRPFSRVNRWLDERGEAPIDWA